MSESILSYVIGVVQGDAYLSNGRVLLEVADKDFASNFAKSLGKLCSRKPYPIIAKVRQEGNRHYSSYLVSGGNKRIFGLLSQCIKSLKPIIEEQPSMFLRGFFDSEGTSWIGHSWKNYKGKKYCYSYPCVAVYNTDKQLLEYVQRLLTKLDIQSILSVNHPKGTKLRIRGHTSKRRKTVWVLRIRQQLSVSNFFEKIGFSIMRKQAIWRRHPRK